MVPTTPSMLDNALALALKGLHVFPITPGEKAPPLVKQWQISATTNPGDINLWWDQWPNANIGCHVGASGHVVLDIDVKNGVDGFETLRGLEMRYGITNFLDAEGGRHPLPPTGWNVETPSGGLHIWYTLPKGLTIANSVGKLGPGVDVRSLNGYVLMPPSKLDAMELPYKWIPPVKFPKITGS